ncbi:hypothetical protein C1645_821825 [Glomus cerebriforme]|uniref:F-box domain-containing protein n=1 Tax=Glomus cerebriforme TaxID=658196 RepID=A0A397T5Z4_9GLOM|nr:hypothetical protein C1645_821825 [Glomus cerebriforme]
MPYQLPIDCLNEIFEHLENDKSTLHSCLLTNRLWFACLPKESLDLLYENEIFIPTPTSESPLFNYPAFCEVFSIANIFEIIDNVLEKSPITSQNLKDRRNYLTGDCLIDLSELYCSSELPSEFFYQLSQKCHNLLSLNLRILTMNFDIELKKLISLQNNLKNLILKVDKGDWADIIPILIKHSNTFTKLHLHGYIELTIPLSFVASFPNLQEIIFSFSYGLFEVFEKLHVTFPKLQILNIPNIPYQCPKPEHIMQFLENNGKNLKKFYIGMEDNNLYLSIAKFCSNLKVLSTIFNFDKLDTLKIIFNSCQYLESIKIWYGEGYLGENENDFIISLENNEENMKIIEKYKNLGIIKFKTVNYDDENDDFSI